MSSSSAISVGRSAPLSMTTFTGRCAFSATSAISSISLFLSFQHRHANGFRTNPGRHGKPRLQYYDTLAGVDRAYAGQQVVNIVLRACVQHGDLTYRWKIFYEIVEGIAGFGACSSALVDRDLPLVEVQQ